LTSVTQEGCGHAHNDGAPVHSDKASSEQRFDGYAFATRQVAQKIKFCCLIYLEIGVVQV
jgi:hypothetical protein